MGDEHEDNRGEKAPLDPPEAAEGPRPAALPSPAPAGSGGGARLYRRVVYARVTDAEWLSVRTRAADADLSMSRYLVRAALTPGRPPPTREERARLEDLLYRLRRAAIRLRQLAGLGWLRSADPDTAEMAREAASLLEALTRDVARRVRGDIPGGGTTSGGGKRGSPE